MNWRFCSLGLQALMALVSLGSLVSCGSSASAKLTLEEPQFDPAFHMSDQTTMSRTYRPWRSRRVAAITVPNSSLYRVRADHANHIFMLDRASGCIIRLDRNKWEKWDRICIDGSMTKTKLRAFITDFDLDERGDLILSAGRALWRRNSAGQITQFPDSISKTVGNSAFTLEQGQVIYLPFPAPDEASSFRSVDLTGPSPGTISSVPRFLRQNKDLLFSVAGKFTADHVRHVVYHASDRSGLLVSLQAGRPGISLGFARGTIDHTPLSRLERPQPNVLRFPFGQPVVSLDLATDPSRLWILTKAPFAQKTFRFVLDGYDAASGEYQYSHELPIRARGFTLADNLSLFIVGDTLEVWDSSST